ncbi:MAG: hypothetical protein KGI87_05540 [Burkholderiales bacterium]|nr:hypothetical protein [Burkholderiales bacterium]
MTRGLRRAVARGLIGILLLAQFAVLAYACPALTAASTASMAMANDAASADPADATTDKTAVASAGCDGMTGMTGATDPAAPNLCAEHCKYGQQSDLVSTPAVPAVLLTALYATPWVPHTALPARRAAGLASALVAASPPHTTLHCVYRI